MTDMKNRTYLPGLNPGIVRRHDDCVRTDSSVPVTTLGTNSHQVRSCSCVGFSSGQCDGVACPPRHWSGTENTQDSYIWWMPEHNATTESQANHPVSFLIQKKGTLKTDYKLQKHLKFMTIKVFN